MSESKRPKQRSSKYHRARIRNFLFTSGPHKLSGGRITRRHLAHDVVVREIDVFSPNWPRAFDGLRIGHVSDFHVGDLLPLDAAHEVVQLLADQSPDFIACTGDIVDLHHEQARPLLDSLGSVATPFGSALVLGNHDHLDDAQAVVNCAEQAGLVVLMNSAMRIARGKDHLLIGGIDWARSAVQCAQFVDLACGDFVHLLLSHNPKAFLRAADLGVPLTLAGHTHGGQIALKSGSKINFALAHAHRRNVGLFDSHGSRMYVTSGVGAWLPLRVNCPPEIAMLTLHRAEVPPHQAGAGRTKKRRTRTAPRQA